MTLKKLFTMFKNESSIAQLSIVNYRQKVWAWLLYRGALNCCPVVASCNVTYGSNSRHFFSALGRGWWNKQPLITLLHYWCVLWFYYKYYLHYYYYNLTIIVYYHEFRVQMSAQGGLGDFFRLGKYFDHISAFHWKETKVIFNFERHKTCRR